MKKLLLFFSFLFSYCFSANENFFISSESGDFLINPKTSSVIQLTTNSTQTLCSLDGNYNFFLSVTDQKTPKLTIQSSTQSQDVELSSTFPSTYHLIALDESNKYAYVLTLATLYQVSYANLTSPLSATSFYDFNQNSVTPYSVGCLGSDVYISAVINKNSGIYKYENSNWTSIQTLSSSGDILGSLGSIFGLSHDPFEVFKSPASYVTETGGKANILAANSTKVYATGTTNTTTGIYDVTEGTILDPIYSSLEAPSFLAANDNYLCFNISKGTSVIIYDLKNETTSTIPLSGTINWIATFPTFPDIVVPEERCYVTDYGDSKVKKVNLKTSLIENEYSVFSNPYQIAINSDETLACILHYDPKNSSSVSILNLVTKENTFLDLITLTTGQNNPGHLVVADPLSNYAYVIGDQSFYEIDLEGKTLTSHSYPTVITSDYSACCLCSYKTSTKELPSAVLLAFNNKNGGSLNLYFSPIAHTFIDNSVVRPLAIQDMNAANESFIIAVDQDKNFLCNLGAEPTQGFWVLSGPGKGTLASIVQVAPVQDSNGAVAYQALQSLPLLGNTNSYYQILLSSDQKYLFALGQFDNSNQILSVFDASSLKELKNYTLSGGQCNTNNHLIASIGDSCYAITAAGLYKMNYLTSNLAQQITVSDASTPKSITTDGSDLYYAFLTSQGCKIVKISSDGTQEGVFYNNSGTIEDIVYNQGCLFAIIGNSIYSIATGTSILLMPDYSYYTLAPNNTGISATYFDGSKNYGYLTADSSFNNPTFNNISAASLTSLSYLSGTYGLVSPDSENVFITDQAKPLAISSPLWIINGPVLKCIGLDIKPHVIAQPLANSILISGQQLQTSQLEVLLLREPSLTFSASNPYGVAQSESGIAAYANYDQTTPYLFSFYEGEITYITDFKMPSWIALAPKKPIPPPPSSANLLDAFRKFDPSKRQKGFF